MGKKLTDDVRELKEAVKNFNDQIRFLKVNLQNVFGVTTNTFSFIGDVETRIEALKTLCINGGIFTNDGFEEEWDKIKGLRVKEKGENIENSDFVRIRYSAKNKDDGKIMHIAGNGWKKIIVI